MGILSKMAKDKAFKDCIGCVKDIPPMQHISTGLYALNGIISGNVNLGISADSIVALVGPSNSGKSLILAHLVKHAIEDGYEVMLFDSERSVSRAYYENIGCDVSKMFFTRVGSTLKFRNKAHDIIQEFYANAGPKDKLFVGLDSLGNLASEKEMADVEKGKTASDQGNNAKMQNSAFRVISALAGDFNFPWVFTNHVYAPIGDLFAQRSTIAGGGKGIYNSNTIIYCDRLVNKEEVEDALGKKKKIQIGIKIKATTVKNRLYPEEKSVYLDLRYDSGVNKYSGLLQFAIRAGVIENKSRGFLVTATGKTVFEKNLYTPEIFNEAALEKINEWLGKNGYSSLSEIFSDDVAKELGDGDGKEKS